MKIENFAKAFNISVRSMQKLLKELEVENVISRELVYKENGRKKANCIIFIGAKPRFTGKKSADRIGMRCGQPFETSHFPLGRVLTLERR